MWMLHLYTSNVRKNIYYHYACHQFVDGKKGCNWQDLYCCS